MNVKLVYFGEFESTLNGVTFKIKRFVDPQTLTILYGTNLEETLEEGKMYTCTISIKRNKLVVVKVI